MSQDKMRAYLEENRWHFVSSEILGFCSDGDPCSRIDTLVRKSGEKKFVYILRDGRRIEISQELTKKLVETFTRPVHFPANS